jgi:frataxin-like iron-binding protein CyaY
VTVDKEPITIEVIDENTTSMTQITFGNQGNAIIKKQAPANEISGEQPPPHSPSN